MGLKGPGLFVKFLWYCLPLACIGLFGFLGYGYGLWVMATVMKGLDVGAFFQ